MGGGSKRSRDVSKGAPGNPLAAVAEGFGDGAAESYSYCRQEHWLSFRMAPGARLKPGVMVRLVAAHPIQVMGEAGLVGELDAEQSVSMRGCLEAGYRMVGSVRAADLQTRVGVLVVQGEPLQ